MSDQALDNDNDDLSQEVDELSLLKQRAQLMGIVFSNNIGLDKLKQRIKQHMDGEITQPEVVTPVESVTKVKTKTLRQHLIDTNMKVIRLRITNMDPKKASIPGEIITVANEYLGTVRKYIPFGEVTENGYHVPYCIYKELKARKFLNIRTIKNRNKPGETLVEQTWVSEYALEVLPQLTADELAQLATTQAASGSIG